MEDQVIDLLVGKVCIGRNEIIVDRLLAHLFAIDAGAVVCQLDDDASGAMLGREPHGAFGALARGNALIGRFQAVIDRVADHVRERLGELVYDRLVDFRVFTLGDETNGFAGHVGDFADNAGHALEDRLYRLRADRHDAILDFARKLLQLLQPHIDRRRAVGIVLDYALRQHRLVDDEFADEVDQTIDTIEIDANGRGRGRSGLLRGNVLRR